jgi:nucleoside-diphosphate-sugar epimerase
MKVLIIGGTGLISTGIVKHLLARKADIAVFNRSKRENTLPASVKALVGNRDEVAALSSAINSDKFDCIIDMICFRPDQATAVIETAAGKCKHFIFCSTVCTYGIKSPPSIFVDETFPQEPISNYGKDKLACEQLFLKAHAQGKLNSTIIRPSCTYGPGNALIDNLEGDAVAWDRIVRNQPVLCAGDGLGLWVATHRDDCGKLFAYGALNPKTYGQSYNATRAEHTTWRDFFKQVAEALDRQANLIFMPAGWIVRHDPKRFGLLREITQYHGAYDSGKAVRDVPEFKCEISLTEGAKTVFADQHRRGVWRDSTKDAAYQLIVDEASKLGCEPVVA